MSTNLVIHRDPFRIHLDVEQREIQAGLTIFETLIEAKLAETSENGINRIGTYVVLHNGEYLLAKDWSLVLNDGDFLQVGYLPKGGGGGSNIGNIIGAIVIAVAAYFTMGLSLLASAAVGVGAMAIMSLMTGAVPAPSTSLNSSRESTSPTYSLNAQGNSARLLEAMPKVYGRMRTYPDLAAQPYAEYEGNEQYLYQLFCLSLGQVEIEQIFIDETPIESFEDATVQVIRPNEAVTLFPDNVITSDAVSGLEMLAPNNPNYSILGPFITAPGGTKANRLAVDVSFPQGLGRVNDEGATQSRTIDLVFEYREVNDTGEPVSAWGYLANRSFSFATKQPQVVSLFVDVPLGRYEVRGYRLTNEGDNRTWDMAQWISLRSYLQSTHVYGNCTLIAVKMRATNVLNSSTARKFSVISKGFVQKWDPINGWGNEEFSNNPAWIAADILRNSDYGRGLLTERLAMPKLYQLANTWQTRGDTFNGVFDTTSQLWEALSQVLRVGRAVPIYYAGVIDFVRDEPASIPSSVFQPANMVMGSFKTTYSFHDVDTPDHVVVEYIDTTTWKSQTVDCKLPGEPALNPFNVTLFGCTDRDQAWREGISMAAANRDRRRNISFASLTEGYIPRYNGLARVSHDVPQWGYFGRVETLDRTNGRLRTSEPIPFNDSSPHVIAFRKRDGSEDGPYSMVKDTTLDEKEGEYGCIVSATLEQLREIYISDGVREDQTYYQCGPTEHSGIKVLVMSAMPDGKGQVNIQCINYAESVHTAELGGLVPPPPPESELPITPAAPIVSTVTLVYTTEVGVQSIVASAAAGAIYYEFAAKLSTAQDWANLGTSSEPTLRTNLSPGLWSVRVRGVGRATGPWATWSGTVEATSLPTPTLDLFAATSKLFAIGLNWSYAAETNTIADRVEVWVGVTNILGDASKLVTLPFPANAFDQTSLGAGERRYYWARVIDTAGRVGPWYNGAQPITEIATVDMDKLTEALEDKISKLQLTEDLRTEIESGGESATEIAEIREELRAAITLRAQVTRPDGTPVIAGIGIGVEPEEGELISSVLIMAQRFAVIDQSDPSGPVKSPFIVENGEVYINSLFVKTATIQDALIGATLKSVAVNQAGLPLVEINLQTGTSITRGQSSLGSTIQTNTTHETFDENNIRRTRLGLWE